jgi:hypothetical protein
LSGGEKLWRTITWFLNHFVKCQRLSVERIIAA